jgi:hypothetical protein
MPIYRRYDTEESRRYWRELDRYVGKEGSDEDYKPEVLKVVDARKRPKRGKDCVEEA